MALVYTALGLWGWRLAAPFASAIGVALLPPVQPLCYYSLLVLCLSIYSFASASASSAAAAASIHLFRRGRLLCRLRSRGDTHRPREAGLVGALVPLASPVVADAPPTTRKETRGADGAVQASILQGAGKYTSQASRGLVELFVVLIKAPSPAEQREGFRALSCLALRYCLSRRG